MRENQLLDHDSVTLGQLLTLKPDDVPALVFVAPGATVRQALRLMRLHDVSQLAVMDAGSCVGVVIEGGLSTRALEDPKLLDAAVSTVMDPPLPVVEQTAVLEQVTRLLTRTNPAVLVRRNGEVAGIVTRSDVLHHMMSR